MNEPRFNCPKCKSPRLAYWERVLAYYDMHGSHLVRGPSYEHNDPKETGMNCRDCGHSFPVPLEFLSLSNIFG